MSRTPAPPTAFVAYLRVSTTKQGTSGLGLDAQRHTINNYVQNLGTTPLAYFTEVESGTKKGKRVEIYKALAYAKERNATLIVAKLDRLARDVQFVLSIMDAGVDVVFCDFPGINRFMITILAAIAEYEAKLISDRTKAALQAKKRQGVKLGNPNAAEALKKARIASAKSRSENSVNKKHGGIIAALRESNTLAETARFMNESQNTDRFTTGIVFNIAKAHIKQLQK